MNSNPVRLFLYFIILARTKILRKLLWVFVVSFGFVINAHASLNGVAKIEITSALSPVDFVQVGEVIARNTNGANVSAASAGATAAVTGTMFSYVGGNAIDSNTTSFWHSAARGGTITITLANVEDLESIEIFGRSNSNFYRDYFHVTFFNENGNILNSIDQSGNLSDYLVVDSRSSAHPIVTLDDTDPGSLSDVSDEYFPVASYAYAQSHVINTDNQNAVIVTDQNGTLGKSLFPLVADRDLIFKFNIVKKSGVGTTTLDDIAHLYTSVGVSNSHPTWGHDYISLTTERPTNPNYEVPSVFPSGDAEIVHSFKDSFVARIPGEYVRPGMEIWLGNTGSWGAHVWAIPKPEVVLPTHETLTLFDLTVFGNRGSQSMLKDHILELGDKLPASQFTLRQAPAITFEKMAYNTYSGVGPSIVESYDEWLSRYGDNETSRGMSWQAALKQANGWNYGEYSTTCIQLHGLPSDTTGSGNTNHGCLVIGKNTSTQTAGGFWHEYTHALGLAAGHFGGGYPWNSALARDRYPYKLQNTYQGVSAAPTYNQVHRGSTWAFDSIGDQFLSPIYETTNGDTHWRGAVQQGGGLNFGAPNFTILSDWTSAIRILPHMRAAVRWLEAGSIYASDGEGWYVQPVAKDGSGKTIKDNAGNLVREAEFEVADWYKKLSLPQDPNTEVYSILFDVNMASDPSAGVNPFGLIYPPIGKYVGGLGHPYDPRNSEDRTDASHPNKLCGANSYFFGGAGSCHYTLKVVQEHHTGYYLVKAPKYDTSKDWRNTSGDHFFTKAINVPASQGKVMEAQLLSTPDVVENWQDGMLENAQVLATWVR